MEAAQENFLVQMIDFPTHSKGNILDLVLTKNPEKVASIIDVGPVGNSDHTGIMVEFYHEKTINTTDQLVHDWNNADILGLRNEMMLTDWDTTMQDLDADESWRFFHSKIIQLTDKYIPMNIRTNNRPVRMNRKIIRASRHKQRLYNNYKLTKTQRT